MSAKMTKHCNNKISPPKFCKTAHGSLVDGGRAEAHMLPHFLFFRRPPLASKLDRLGALGGPSRFLAIIGGRAIVTCEVWVWVSWLELGRHAPCSCPRQRASVAPARRGGGLVAERVAGKPIGCEVFRPQCVARKDGRLDEPLGLDGGAFSRRRRVGRRCVRGES